MRSEIDSRGNHLVLISFQTPKAEFNRQSQALNFGLCAQTPKPAPSTRQRSTRDDVVSIHRR